MYVIPNHWTHGGLVLARTDPKIYPYGNTVIGDPCIVRDESVGGWRMVLFCDPPGHGQAVCRDPQNVGPGQWTLTGPLQFTNPQSLLGGTHKPYIVQEAHRPNHAAKVDGKYWLVSVGHTKAWKKFVHRAWATELAGPWTWEEGMLIPPGGAGEWDEKHTDAVTGIYFADREEFLYFYMGYPKVPEYRAISPFGSAQGAATQRLGESKVTKLGMILPPAQQAGHWASGWVGGLQPIPGKQHRWVAMINASPTAPVFNDVSQTGEEPPPSLGGFAVCDEEFPTRNWRWLDEPIERIEQLPADAVANGEGVNLWRHYVLILPDGKSAVFYNTGKYGTEQMYMKWG